MGKLIFLSDGLTTKIGFKLLKNSLSDNNLNRKRILIVMPPKYDLEEALYNSFGLLGFEKGNIIFFSKNLNLDEHFDYIYVTEGNTFEILDFINRNGLAKIIKRIFKSGNSVYIGSSAGAMIAGKDIKLAIDFDQNLTGITNLKALCLFDGTIIPHYTHSELKRYVKLTDNKALMHYRRIYSVGNGDILILNIN